MMKMEMRTIISLICCLCAIDEVATAGDALILNTPIQCVIKKAVIKKQRSSIGTNTVFHISVTVELVNSSTKAIDIDRDSLVVALYTTRLADTNGFSWEMSSPLSRYRYHPLEGGQRDVIGLRGGSTNQTEVTLTSLDGPFVLVNRQLFLSIPAREMPTQMSGSMFTTVLGRVVGERRTEKVILQGASSFDIRHE